MIKPDQDIFILIGQKYHLKPQETLFIDDTLANCEAA